MLRIREVNARSWVTAATIISVATAHRRKPPRNSHGLAPSGPTSHMNQTSAARIANPVNDTRSSRAPLRRSGPRITATGRQIIANAAPSSNPLARVNVPR
jgi:hypothetical protein